MRSLLLVALLAGGAGLIVAAVVFRSSSARSSLRFIRNAAWLYIAFIVLLALFRLWQS